MLAGPNDIAEVDTLPTRDGLCNAVAATMAPTPGVASPSPREHGAAVSSSSSVRVGLGNWSADYSCVRINC